LESISETGKAKTIYLNLDRFQQMKLERMNYLLGEIEEKKEIPISQFLSNIAIKYGIRRATGLEYLRDWADGGYIKIENNTIRFVKRPDD
jgi:hypothetical protein